MTAVLVLVHGRAQHFRDPDELKGEWLDALRRGLATCGRTLPIPDSEIRFPFYGAVLRELMDRPDEDMPVTVPIRGDDDDLDPHRTRFVRDSLREIAAEAGASVTQTDGDVVERGAIYSAPVHMLLAALDRHVPGAGDTAVRLLDDVYSYLHVPHIGHAIDDGVGAALDVPSDQPSPVVVAHSLGSVVAYRLLRRLRRRSPLLVTLGSPLGVTAVRRRLEPVGWPAVDRWTNARDTRDLVALHPLTRTRFPVLPPIEDIATVDNRTPNRHGVSGYLSDPVVASRIHDALVACG